MNLRFQVAACFVLTLCGWCALCRAEQGAPPQDSDLLQTSVEAVNSPIYPGEPLGLRLMWHNASQQYIELPFLPLVQINVSADGKPPLLFRLPIRSLACRVGKMTLASGKSYEEMVVVTTGATEGGPTRFILDKAGTYRVWPDGFDQKSAATVKVEDPPEAERAARELWTPRVALFAEVGFSKSTQDIIDAIDEIVSVYPESRYAPYAAYGKSLFLFRGPEGNGPTTDSKAVI